MKIRYTDTLDGITASMLGGFFVGWLNPPTPERHLDILRGSDYVVLALDDERNQVVGFINAISDGVLNAYLPLLEVLADYQNRGIARCLVEKMLTKLKHLYAIDLVCDEDVAGLYEKLGFKRAQAMIVRHYDRQNGE